MKRTIKKVAILGSGVMGSRIACHFAGIGVQTLLLDIVPSTATESTKLAERNKLVNDALAAAVKSNPSPLYTQAALANITTGNFTDNQADIATADWVLEVVIEKLDIKKQVYEWVEKHRKPGTLITSNTSGIPIHLLSEGRSEDFKANFCGTHFFNPPRYLRLLEIIPTPNTNPDVVTFLMSYGDKFLGKETVLCKDTPAFIANRVGVFSIMAILKIKEQLGLTIDEVETLTGPIIGRPKSATFRTADVVGLDTLVKVANGVADNCPNDEAKAVFAIPAYVQQMLDNKWLGDKTGQGFFSKTKNEMGKSEIATLDLATMQYVPKTKSKFATLEAAKPIDDLSTRLKVLYAGTDKAGEFYRQFHYHLFSYIAHRIPEISDTLYSLDAAMQAGFGWEIGAFETWDVLGVQKTVEAMQAASFVVPAWVTAMLHAGNNTFYKVENNTKKCYNPANGAYEPIANEANAAAYIVMKNFENETVWKNSACRTYHLGNDVLGLEWYTKMGSIGGEVLEGVQKSITLAEEKYKGLVIANSGTNFSAGANVAMIFMMALEQDYDEIDMAIRQFQNTVMRIRYSSIPVVIAPHGLALGGGCEMCLHADKVIAAAETYTGLVEVGIGVIPGGAGTKEFVLRAAQEMHTGEPENITLQNRFLTIATAKVATSAYDAYDLGIYQKNKDSVAININRRIADAKKAVLELYEAGYTTPIEKTAIKVLGKSALGAMLAGIHGMKTAGYATAHDAVVSNKLAYVMCGGNLSEPTMVSERY